MRRCLMGEPAMAMEHRSSSAGHVMRVSASTPDWAVGADPPGQEPPLLLKIIALGFAGGNAEAMRQCGRLRRCRPTQNVSIGLGAEGMTIAPRPVRCAPGLRLLLNQHTAPNNALCTRQTCILGFSDFSRKIYWLR